LITAPKVPKGDRGKGIKKGESNFYPIFSANKEMA